MPATAAGESGAPSSKVVCDIKIGSTATVVEPLSPLVVAITVAEAVVSSRTVLEMVVVVAPGTRLGTGVVEGAGVGIPGVGVPSGGDIVVEVEVKDGGLAGGVA